MVAMVMFAGSLVLLAIAIMMNKRVLYLLALPSSALAYAQFPMIQIARNWLIMGIRRSGTYCWGISWGSQRVYS